MWMIKVIIWLPSSLVISSNWIIREDEIYPEYSEAFTDLPAGSPTGSFQEITLALH